MSGPSDGPIAGRIAEYRQRIERVLDLCLTDDDGATPRLHAAMRYSVLGGGKRLRPTLVYLTGEAFDAPLARLDRPAAAVELIHAYSLIHDDLPAMDDDDLRRGRPSCHRAFDEGTAILAGDALQALAFDVLAQAGGIPGVGIPSAGVANTGDPDAGQASAAQRVLMLGTLARAIGTAGMAGGQAIDLAAIGRPMTPEAIERMHRRKTGALIQASVELGALGAGLTHEASLQALRAFGAEIGLAFQIQDDILDITGETHVIGKRQGADAALGKPTYPSVFGLEAARRLAMQHHDRALGALEALGGAAAPLRELARFVVERPH